MNDKIDWSQYEVKDQPNDDEFPIPGTTGLSGVGSDIYHGLTAALRSGRQFISDIPSELKKESNYIESHPGSTLFHNLGQVAAESADIGKALINSPSDLSNYLIKKKLHPAQAFIPEEQKLSPVSNVSQLGNQLAKGAGKHYLKSFSEQLLKGLSKNLPGIPEDTGIEKALGLEANPEKGDRLIRGITEAAGIATAGAPVVKTIKKFATSPSKEKLFQRALEDRIEEAAKTMNMSKEQLNTLQDALKRDYSEIHGELLGEATPLSLQEKINVAEHKLKQKKPLTEIPEKKVGEIPQAPDTKTMIAENQKAIDNARKATESKLGVKENPSITARSKIKKAIENVKNSASDLYKSARNHYQDKKISADNSAEIKAATKELEEMKNADELAPGYGSGTAEQKALESQIDALKGEKVNASDIFDLQRTLETMAEKTRQKQFAGKVPELEFKRLGNIADRLESHAAKLAKRLESVGGDDVQKIMTEANKGWRTYKQLTKENPIGKAAIKGNIPNDALIKLADEYPANDFLRGLVDSDPELRKNLLAIYTGENNVNRLINPSSAINNVLKSLPEVEEHVQSLKNAISDYKSGKVDAARIEKEHRDLAKSMQKEAEQQKIRKDAIEESNKLKQQIKFKKDAIPKIEAKMKEVEINSAEYKKLQKELADHRKFIEDKGGRLKELAKFFVKVKAVGAVNLP